MNTLLSLILLFIMLQHFNDKKEWAILVLKKKKKKKRPWDVYAKNLVPLHKDDVEIP